MMRRFWVVFSVLVAFSLNATAQKEGRVRPDPGYRHLIKWNPATLIDFTPSFQFAYEYRATPALGLSLEAGYINNLLIEWPTEEYYDMQGIRVRFEPRWYPNMGNKNAGILYFTPEMVFIRYNFLRTREYGYNCGENNFGGPRDCDYFRIATYNGQKSVFATHFKIGTQGPLDRNQRIWLDAYVGFGFRYLNVDTWGQPVGGIVTTRDFPFANDENEDVLGSASVGFKIAYRIR